MWVFIAFYFIYIGIGTLEISIQDHEAGWE